MCPVNLELYGMAFKIYPEGHHTVTLLLRFFSLPEKAIMLGKDPSIYDECKMVRG